MMKDWFKSSNDTGITLIALVITIIVLLILAGVTITSLSTNDSAINKAQEAKIATERAEAGEELFMAVINIKTKQYLEEQNKISYYTDKTTFVEKSGFDENKYNIKTYDLNQNTNRLRLVIVKETGSKTDLVFEIDLKNDKIIYQNN